jgi:hypothetical protein
VKRVGLAIAIAACAGGAVASGHHSFSAAYHEERRVSVDGEVVSFEYRSPHAWVHLDVRDQNGEVQRYSAEWSNPARLKRDGLTPESIQPGDRVIITGSPGRNPAERKIHLKSIQRPADGWLWPVRRSR